MDICQSVLAIFFSARGRPASTTWKEPDDLIKLLLTMTRNKVAEKMRSGQHRLAPATSRRTVGGVEELALAGLDLDSEQCGCGYRSCSNRHGRRLSEEERQLVELRGQGFSWEEVAASLGGGRPGARAEPAWPARLDRVALVRELRLDEAMIGEVPKGPKR